MTTAPAAPPFLTRIRLRAERRVLWMRKLWSAANDPARGLAISDGDVDRILADAAAVDAAEDAFYRDDPAARALTANIAEADAADDHAFDLLRRTYDLGDADCNFLALCVAADADPMLRRVYGYLHDDATLGAATPWLATMLFGGHEPVAVGPGSPLMRWRLARPADGYVNSWGAATPWIADPFATTLVLHRQLHDGVIAHGFELIDTAAAHALPDLHPEALRDAAGFIGALGNGHRTSNAPLEIELVAPAGAGKRTFAAQLCDRLGLNLIAADAAALQAGDAAGERLLRLGRLARAARAALYLGGADTLDLRPLDGSVALVITGGDVPRGRAGAVRKSLRLPRLDREARRTLWSTLTPLPMPLEFAQWALTPGEIAGIAAVAPAGAGEIAAACRDIGQRAPGELFSPLPLPYTCDDIVLSPTVRRHLQEFEDQVRLRFAVMEEWGFERSHPAARGVSALFAGPSGTGKTMAAQVMARTLGMDLYRVDLAGVVNKYIGETEKRLKVIFDSCERANVLLFFDEADALFGHRTQVKDAHDRFANIEVDYLLQRMEQFDGIAVLATNRRSDLDKAFVRRLRFIVDFMQPGPAERRELWRRALPETTPAGEPLLDDIDFELLASRLAMTGADIKLSALGAAFLARSEGARIAMRHVLAAARREMTKHGVELRPGDLGETA